MNGTSDTIQAHRPRSDTILDSLIDFWKYFKQGENMFPNPSGVFNGGHIPRGIYKWKISLVV